MTFTPAAADTIMRYFEGGLASYGMPDLIVTGDLGFEGSGILRDIMRSRGFDIEKIHTDCGLMIFNREAQDKHSGGSGCGCSASVMAADIIPNIASGVLGEVLFVGTGALMNAMSLQQGQSIPGIAHLVRIKTQKTAGDR